MKNRNTLSTFLNYFFKFPHKSSRKSNFRVIIHIMFANPCKKTRFFSYPLDIKFVVPQNSQHTAHSTQHTAHSTQHTAHEFYALAENSLSKRSLRLAYAITLPETKNRATCVLNQNTIIFPQISRISQTGKSVIFCKHKASPCTLHGDAFFVLIFFISGEVL